MARDHSSCCLQRLLALDDGLHRSLTLGRCARAVEKGAATREEALGRYTRETSRDMRVAYQVFILLLTLALSTPLLWPGVATQVSRAEPVSLAAGITAFCVAAWYITQLVVSGAIITSDAGLALRGRRVKRSMYMAIIAKTVTSRYLPALALVEVAAALLWIKRSDLLWLLPLLACLAFLLHTALASYEQRWYFGATPLANTKWTPLASRIDLWAKRAGTTIATVQVLHAQRLASAGGSLMGIGKPTIVLSDSFLEATDWRQQDAMLAWLLSRAGKRAEVIVTSAMYATVEAAVLAGLFWVLNLETAASSSLSMLAPVFVTPLVAIATSYTLGRFQVGYHFERYAQAADRAAAELTGDPRALMVALHSFGVLAGRRDIVQKRINRLDHLQTRPGPWAPWAATVVPAQIPLSVAGRVFTSPLVPAPSPADVPKEPYPITTLAR